MSICCGFVRLFLNQDMIEYYMVHLGGFLLDLTVGFWLLWPKSRPWATFFTASFHAMNSQLFTIGIQQSFNTHARVKCNLVWCRDVSVRLSSHFTCFLR